MTHHNRDADRYGEQLTLFEFTEEGLIIYPILIGEDDDCEDLEDLDA